LFPKLGKSYDISFELVRFSAEHKGSVSIYHQTDLMTKKDVILKTGIGIRFLEKGACKIYPQTVIHYDVDDVFNDMPKDIARKLVKRKTGEYVDKESERMAKRRSLRLPTQREPHRQDKLLAEKYPPRIDKELGEKNPSDIELD